jgi:hypothetical protein
MKHLIKLGLSTRRGVDCYDSSSWPTASSWEKHMVSRWQNGSRVGRSRAELFLLPRYAVRIQSRLRIAAGVQSNSTSIGCWIPKNQSGLGVTPIVSPGMAN